MHDLPEPVPVAQALKASDLDVVVPDGESLTLGPFVSRHASAFRLAEILEFGDLHRLGWIPGDIDERQARTAILADDRIYREVALHGRDNGATRACECGGEQHVAARQTRRRVQTHLIDLLQPLALASLSVDHPTLTHTYSHLRRWFSKPARYLVGITVLADISVGNDSTLTMTPAVQGLYARDVSIGKRGTLRFTGGAVHVSCRTLNGPSRFTDSTTVLEKVGRYVQGVSREVQRLQS